MERAQGRTAWPVAAIAGMVGVITALAAPGLAAETIYKSLGRDGSISYGNAPAADAARTDALQFGPYQPPVAPVASVLAQPSSGALPGDCGARSADALTSLRDMMAELEARRAADLEAAANPPLPLYGYAPVYPGIGRGRFGNLPRGNPSLANQPPYPNAPFGPPGNSLLRNDVRIQPERPAARQVVPSGSAPPAVVAPAPRRGGFAARR